MAVVRRSATRLAAHHIQTQAALTRAAADLAVRARAIALTRRDTGAYAESFRVARARVDRLVFSVDPDAGFKEFGRPAGRHGAAPGVFALTRAAAGEGG